jgi:hypothetical protein
MLFISRDSQWQTNVQQGNEARTENQKSCCASAQ